MNTKQSKDLEKSTSINFDNKYGIKTNELREYYSEEMGGTVLLAGDSVYVVHNPNSLPVYRASDLDAVKEFKRLGGDPTIIYEAMKTWPESRIKINHHEIPYWDQSKLPYTETPKQKKTSVIESVFRLQESLSSESMKTIASTKKVRRSR